MIWIYPHTIWFLLAVPLIALAAILRGKRAGAYMRLLEQDSFELLVRVFLRDFAMAVFFALVILAIAEPRNGKKPVAGESSGLDVVIVFDSSRSMLVEDVQPNRLERARLALRQITRDLSVARFALISFSDRAIPLIPITEDKVVLNIWIDRLGPGVSSSSGTNLESALAEAAAMFPSTEGRDVAVLLITDGESLEGKMKRSLQEFTERGIPIHILAAGTEEGGRIPTEKGYIKDKKGLDVISRMHASVLRQASLRTGGSYHPLAQSGSVGNLIAALNSQEILLKQRGIHFEIKNTYRSILIPALIFLLFSMLIRIFPWKIE